MDAAPLPGGVENRGDGRLDALADAADDQPDPAQAAPRPRAQTSVQIGSASDVAISRPETARRPSVFTPMARMTATETTRPPRRISRPVASIRKQGQSPSRGRFEKAFTGPSISAHRPLTWLVEMPDIPAALTRSSTDRVEKPCAEASWMTALSAPFAIRRGSSRPRQELPVPSPRVRRPTIPTRVSQSGSRSPFRCVRCASHGAHLPLQQPFGRKADHFAQQIGVRGLSDEVAQGHHRGVIGEISGQGRRQQPDPTEASPVPPSPQTQTTALGQNTDRPAGARGKLMSVWVNCGQMQGA